MSDLANGHVTLTKTEGRPVELPPLTMQTLRNADEALERAKRRIDELGRGERPFTQAELLSVRRDVVAVVLRLKSIMEQGW